MPRWNVFSLAVALVALTGSALAFAPTNRIATNNLPSTTTSTSTSTATSTTTSTTLLLAATPPPPTTNEKDTMQKATEATEKYGLEVGLWESLKSKDGGESAKSLLKRYGIAYLATSIPLAIISFSLCYFLVDHGVDVGSLLGKVGIENSSTTETAGTFAIAYAAHKAASPIRFPPTVLLTPIVAKIIGKEPTMEEDAEVEA